MADFNMSGNDTPQEKNTSANEKPTLLRVGITHGDTNGVGYEIILKAFAEQTMFEVCTPVVFGSAKIGSYHRKALGIETQFHFVNSAKDAVDGRLNLVNCFDNDVNVEFGRTSQEAGRAAYWALEAATEALLANDVMRVALVTTHLPISEVAAAITKENVAKKIRQLNKSLQHDFLISAPRIAVLGLNPHNGDDGVMGHEEKEAIAPAVQEAVEQGIQCFGPYPADGFFGAGMFSHFDAVLAMYHDQGLAPFKALSMDNGVNITAGLPYVRTSPDHGTAFDIAGCNKASEASFRQAIYTAIDIHRNRKADDEARKNPLPKLYHERKEDGNRNRHVTPNAAAEGKTPVRENVEEKAE